MLNEAEAAALTAPETSAAALTAELGAWCQVTARASESEESEAAWKRGGLGALLGIFLRVSLKGQAGSLQGVWTRGDFPVPLKQPGNLERVYEGLKFSSRGSSHEFWEMTGAAGS